MKKDLNKTIQTLESLLRLCDKYYQKLITDAENGEENELLHNFTFSSEENVKALKHGLEILKNIDQSLAEIETVEDDIIL